MTPKSCISHWWVWISVRLQNWQPKKAIKLINSISNQPLHGLGWFWYPRTRLCETNPWGVAPSAPVQKISQLIRRRISLLIRRLIILGLAGSEEPEPPRMAIQEASAKAGRTVQDHDPNRHTSGETGPPPFDEGAPSLSLFTSDTL